MKWNGIDVPLHTIINDPRLKAFKTEEQFESESMARVVEKVSARWYNALGELSDN